MWCTVCTAIVFFLLFIYFTIQNKTVYYLHEVYGRMSQACKGSHVLKKGCVKERVFCGFAEGGTYVDLQMWDT